MEVPKIAILGAGIFVKTEYIPKLAEISDRFVLKAIWSRSEESARGAVDVANKFFQEVECKSGDSGLDEIIQDASIKAVIVALAAQIQVDLSMRLLKAGKHVLQEKPAAASFNDAQTAVSWYYSSGTPLPKPIWAIAENYRFEPAFVEGRKLMADIGDLVNFEIRSEVSMNSSNPYFSSSWRHSFSGGYLLDGGVHFIAALRMLVGCEITSVAAMTSNFDTTLPPPDAMSSIILLESGCSGVVVLMASAKTFKVSLRFVGLKGTLHFDVENREGISGYSLTLFTADGKTENSFYPNGGVTEELKTFLHDVSQANSKKDGDYKGESRLMFLEGVRDFAVLDAMLESGNKQGSLVQVKKF